MATRKKAKAKESAKTRKARVAKLVKTCDKRWEKLAKRYCPKGVFMLEKKDAFTVADLRNDKTKVVPDEDFIIGTLWDNGYEEGKPLHAKLKKKLSSYAFNIDYKGDKWGYYIPPCDNMIWELSCAHNTIVKIKHKLLEQQIQSLLLSLHFGDISIEDI